MLLKFASRSKSNIAIIFIVSCLLIGISQEAKPADSHHILVLNSYHRGYLWSDNILSGIESEFARAGLDVELTVEYMDTKRHSRKELFPLLKALYKAKLRHPYDIIIVSDNNALDFILDFREQLPSDIPIVFCGINNFDESMLRGHHNITGVVEDFDLKGTINLALQMYPRTKYIAAFSGASKTAAANVKRLQQVKPDFEDVIRFIDLENLTAPELKNKLYQLPQDTILLGLSFLRDRDGRTFTVKESLNFINSNSRVPIFTAWDHNIASGALGGIVVSGKLQGENAARMAMQILNGTSTADIPIIWDSPNIPMFNYLQMQRFNLTRKDLPEGSQVLYEPVTFYYKYKLYIWLTCVFVSLQTLAIVLLLANIRRRKTAESDLADTEQRFRGTFEQAAVGIAMVATNGRWLRVNQKLCDIVGYSKDEMMQITFQDITHPDDLESDLNYVKQMLDGERQTYSMEKRYIRKDHTFIWINLTVSCVWDEQANRPKYFIAIIEDINSRKEAEEKLKKTTEQLVHSEKLSAVGSLSASFAHEFNNPLQGVMSVIKGLKRRASFSDNDAKLVNMAIDECNRMRDLIKSLQDFNRPSSGRVALMDIHATIDSLLLMSRKEYEVYGITIETNYAEDLPLIKAVNDQIKQVLLNLLNNAAYACKDGGTITINTAVSKGNIVIGVHDTGHGIPPADKDHIFEPFFTTKPEKKGTGLGLSISYGIIQKHGGTIEVESEPEKGTTFTISLPVEGG